MLYGRFIFVFCSLVALGLSTAQSQQQSLIATPDDVPRQVVSKAAARSAYFYDRVAAADGSIPVGARARAWKFAQEELPMFAPRGKGALMSAPEWKNAGPSNIGGRIITVASNPLDPNTVLIGAAGGGIWRTRDAGRSWVSVSDDLPTQAIGALVVNPLDTSIVYVGTGEASYAQRTFDGAGIFRSSDGGTTWKEVGEGTLPDYARISDMVIHPQNPDILFAAIPDGIRDPSLIGIWRSKDAGATWELILTGRMSDIVINAQNPDILYTASSKVFGTGTADRYGMFKTTDGGDNWFPLDIGVADSLMGRTSIGICDAQPDVLYIGVSEVTGDDRTPLLGVFKTMDGGEQWTKLDVPFDYMVSQGWYDNIMGVHPVNPDIAYAGGVKLIVTRDGGGSWERVRDQGYGGIVHVDQHAIDFNRSDPSIVYLGNDGGFFVGSEDGAAWEKRDRGLSITQFIGGAMHPSSDAILFGGTQDNGTLLSDAAPDFGLVLYGDGGNGAINPRRPEVMYTTKETLKFYRSDDFGATWTRKQSGLGLDRSLFYIDFAMDPNNADMLYLGTSRLYKSTNGGDSWILKSSCLIPASGGCYYISAVSVAPYDGNLVFGGGTGGGISISTDAGETWNSVQDSILPTGYCSAVRSFRPGVVLATYATYGIAKVWRSTDMGISWSDISGDLPDVPLNDVIELDGRIIVGSDVGVFITDDDGLHWQRFGSGMPSVSIQRFVFSERTGTLRAHTHGRGMYDLSWRVPDASAPIFVSSPDTSMYDAGQSFVYAPVVDAYPAPRFALLDGPQGASVDSVLGVVRWEVQDESALFTLQAANDLGSTTQQFTVLMLPETQADWRIVQPAMLSTPVNVMALGGREALWLGRDSAMVTRSPDGGRTWTHTHLPGTNAQILDIHAFDADRAVVGTRSGHIMETTDGGASWTTLLSRVNARFGNLVFTDATHGIAVTEDADRTGTALVFRTTDAGVSWEQIAVVPARFPLDNTLTMLDEDHGWFASSNLSKSPPEEPVILRTTDGGATWSEAMVSAQNIAGISFQSTEKGYCVDDMTGFVRRTINGGQHWRSAFYPMGGERLAAVAAFPGSDAFWIVSDEAAWVTPNAGSTWNATSIIPCGSVQDAAFADSANGWIVSKSGVVQRLMNNPLVGVAPVAAAFPSELRIDAVYPNPASARNTSSTISFTTNSGGHIRVAVFNSAGAEVALLVEQDIPAGSHQTVFRTAGLPPGAYFISLASGTKQTVRRIILMR
jgi:photosystem II stability/assembly factor-like uncharacterized protein